MAQVVANFLLRSVGNYSFVLTDFEPLLSSHQAAQLLDINRKTLQKLTKVGRDSLFPRWKDVAFSYIRPECMAGSTAATCQLNSIPEKDSHSTFIGPERCYFRTISTE
jgi:hypothetical protein